jgi:hypothetical protein
MLSIVLQELTESRNARRRLIKILGVIDDNTWGSVTSSVALIRDKLGEIVGGEGKDLNDVVTEVEKLVEEAKEEHVELQEIQQESSPLPAVDVVELFSLLGISERQINIVLQSGDHPRTLLHEVEHNLKVKR